MESAVQSVPIVSMIVYMPKNVLYVTCHQNRRIPPRISPPPYTMDNWWEEGRVLLKRGGGGSTAIPPPLYEMHFPHKMALFVLNVRFSCMDLHIRCGIGIS